MYPRLTQFFQSNIHLLFFPFFLPSIVFCSPGLHSFYFYHPFLYLYDIFEVFILIGSQLNNSTYLSIILGSIFNITTKTEIISRKLTLQRFSKCLLSLDTLLSLLGVSNHVSLNSRSLLFGRGWSTDIQ